MQESLIKQISLFVCWLVFDCLYVNFFFFFLGGGGGEGRGGGLFTCQLLHVYIYITTSHTQ